MSSPSNATHEPHAEVWSREIALTTMVIGDAFNF
jgi:hypothetical protein